MVGTTMAKDPQRDAPNLDNGSGVDAATRRGSGVRKPQKMRRHSRHAVALPVTFAEGDAEPSAGQCANLSLGGMFIGTSDVVPVGTELRIWLTFPDGSRMMLAGTVRWTTADGMGIQHELLGARDTYLLSEFLASLR